MFKIKMLGETSRGLKAIRIAAVSALVIFYQGSSFADAESDWRATIASGIAERRIGNLYSSIDLLSSVWQSANIPAVRALAAGELGESLLQARRYDKAEEPLLEAHKFFSGVERSRYAVDLGNLAFQRRRLDDARKFYKEAFDLAAGDASAQVIAELNLARLVAAQDRLARLKSIHSQLGQITDVDRLARYHLNLGNQARQLGNVATEFAYLNLERSRELASKTSDRRVEVETLDALAQLYEDNRRGPDALRLTLQAIGIAMKLDSGSVADLLISLRWREGRLQNSVEKLDLALAAYQKAVESIEAVRQDLPIEYEDGRSSFQATLEPVYLGYAELLFRKAAKENPSVRSEYLIRIRDVIELIKQSEMQDYLGDRCEVEAIHKDNHAAVAPGVAVLYPVVFPDRTELLLETDSGITWHSTKVDANALRRAAISSSKDLRNGVEDNLPQAQQLYKWLLGPFEDVYAERHIHTLVIVPDGPLRLVAMSALHDGKQYAVEKFAIAMVTGMTMTNSDPTPRRAISALVAGMAEPGPVAEKLSSTALTQILGPGAAAVETTTRGLASARLTRSPRTRALQAALTGGGDAKKREADLRESLALPGVKQEVQALDKILQGRRMLDAEFTVSNFQRSAETGEYQFVHIASHGVFGGSADTSYVMAYDDVLTMNDLQSLLKSERFRRNPIELLTLSACETAEGDERSPLGISGAAIKARAKSVLGTLWPVEDNAARTVMESFYKAIATTPVSKARALQGAQIELIRKPDFSHPFFWAPFVLIGNWH